MATTFAKGLFGVDPAEYSMQQQKLWSNLYAQAGSPYEKMGLALAQIGGTALGLNETAVDKKIADISKVLNDIGTQYQVGTAEYYKAVADALPAEYPDAKAQAMAEFIKFKANETKIYSDAVTAIQKNPEIVDTFADPLKVSVLQKATRKGWSEEETPVPTTVEEMTAFAKRFGLAADPDFRKYTAMHKVAEKEASKEKQEEKKRGLDIENTEVIIKKNKKELLEIGNDFKQGARWNEEREAAIKLLTANGIDWTKELTRRERLNPEIVKAQQLALRNPWAGAGSATITPPPTSLGGTAAPAPRRAPANKNNDPLGIRR